MKQVSSACARWQRLLSTLWDEQKLSPVEKEEFKIHLVECTECSDLYKRTQEMLSTLRGRAKVAPLPHNLAQQIRLKVASHEDSLRQTSSKRNVSTISIAQQRKQHNVKHLLPHSVVFRYVTACVGLLLFWLLLLIILSSIILINSIHQPLPTTQAAQNALIETAIQADATTLNLITIGTGAGLVFSLGILLRKRIQTLFLNTFRAIFPPLKRRGNQKQVSHISPASSLLSSSQERRNSVAEQRNESGAPASVDSVRKQSPTKYQDKILSCRECGNTFTFTAGEQEFYQQKGLVNLPGRCHSCRARHRAEARSGGRSERASREMHSIICSECGMETQVPFLPKDGRPVHCSSCYDKIQQNNDCIYVTKGGK